jgi:hypothetical protein
VTDVRAAVVADVGDPVSLPRHEICSDRPARMFRAVIRSDDNEHVCLSGEASPYNLQILRDRVLARRRPGTRVEVRFASPATASLVRRALRDLDRHGVAVVVGTS